MKTAHTDLQNSREQLAKLDAFLRATIDAQARILAKLNSTSWLDEHAQIMKGVEGYFASAKERLGVREE